jgi:hypothetical protein
MFLVFGLFTLSAGTARAEGTADEDNGYNFSLAATIGEGMFFLNDATYRGPVTLEVVPSIGGEWVKADLGLSTTLESVRIAGTDIGNWAFTARPGARLTPPMIPLYIRGAVPVQIREDNLDWGLLGGVGTDIRLMEKVGLVLEVNTTLSKDLDWGNDGIPLEFRAGMSLYF